MSFLELLSYCTPSKLIIERWHINTVREQNRRQVEVERVKIEVAREESLRQAELERVRIEKLDEQHHRQIQLEIERARFEILKTLIEYGHLSKSASKDVISFVVNDNSQQLLESESIYPAMIVLPSLPSPTNGNDATSAPCSEDNAESLRLSID